MGRDPGGGSGSLSFGFVFGSGFLSFGFGSGFLSFGFGSGFFGGSTFGGCAGSAGAPAGGCSSFF